LVYVALWIPVTTFQLKLPIKLAQCSLTSLLCFYLLFVYIFDDLVLQHPCIYIYIYTHTLYITWTNQRTKQPSQTNRARALVPHAPVSVSSRAPTLFFRPAPLHTLRSSRRGPDRADRRRERRPLVAQSFFRCRSVILLYRQSFCCNELIHFTSLN
jgi:hypothetical protein